MKHAAPFIILLVLILTGCKTSGTEKHQKHRDKIIDVSQQIIDIKPEIIIGGSVLYIIDDALIVLEHSPKGEKAIHLFDKNTFKYLTSTGILGRGPGEIASPGTIGIDNKNRIFWVADFGNKVMWKFPLDSVLTNKMFKPSVKLVLNYESFIEHYGFINDSIVIGKAVQIKKDFSFTKTMSKLNLKTNTIETYGYEHPDAKGKGSNSLFALSLENKFYVNCYFLLDLITICDLNGNLKYNIYGPDGLNNKDYKKSYFFGVDIIDKYIIASYINDIGLVEGINGTRGNSPSKFLILDSEGNYMATIETGYKFTSFCIDSENKRVIVYFEGRAEALGYFNLTL